MKCPHCESVDIARCALVYQAGTITRRSSASASSTYIPGIGVVQANGSGTSTYSTDLAASVRPPDRFRLGEIGCVVVIVGVVLSYPAFRLSQDLTLVPMALLVPPGIAFYIWQRITHWKAMRLWAASWVCLRCGKQWIP